MTSKYEIIQTIKRDDIVADEKELVGTGLDIERMVELKLKARPPPSR